MTAIVVDDNRIEEVVLHAGDPRYVDYPPLPYEEAIDRWQEVRPRRPKPRRGELADLASRFGAPGSGDEPI